MTALVFIRHGETDWNRQQRFQGQIDVPLNANGLAQAARLGQRLGAEGGYTLISSDLSRAQQTAAPLAQAWQQTPLLVPGLREQNFGVLEGLDVPTIQREHPALWQDWLAHDGDFALPGGESLRQFHARVVQAVATLVATHPQQPLAIVTHGGVLDMLWRSAQQLPITGLRSCAIPNTGINRLRWVGGETGGVTGGATGGALHIDSWGDDAHLAGLPEQAGTASGER
jgi:2,3-bisphosphoglycerate-dependent phosphoglycerate mutase